MLKERRKNQKKITARRGGNSTNRSNTTGTAKKGGKANLGLKLAGNKNNGSSPKPTRPVPEVSNVKRGSFMTRLLSRKS